MAHQLRDVHGAARAVAYLMLAAVPYSVVTGILMKLGDPLPALLALGATSFVLCVVGLLCLCRPQALPRTFWVAVPFLSTAVVTGLNVVTADTTLGSQLYYLWPLLYAAMFLGRRRHALLTQSGRSAVGINQRCIRGATVKTAGRQRQVR